MSKETSVENHKIYRFISFFELYETLCNKKLRLSKLSTFEDKNEAIGQVIQQQSYYPYTLKTSNQLLEEQASVLHNTYAICWTQESEMIAMWSLYSPDCMSIRVSTSTSKLNAAIEKANQKLHWSNFINEAGSRRLVSWMSALETIKYVDFSALRKLAMDRNKSFKMKCEEKFKSDQSYYATQAGHDDWNDHQEKLQEIFMGGIFLKDISYSHKNEIRGILNCGIRNDVTLNELQEAKTFSTWLHSRANLDELPSYIFIDVENNFIDDICFDPRIPAYKKDVFMQLLKGISVRITESKAFGSHLDGKLFELESDELE